MKLPILVFSLLAVIGAGAASAHMVDGERRGMMEQMMGTDALEAMEAMEDEMMGAERHERMEEFMDKLFAGKLTAAEQQEMVAMMRDREAGPGATTMMMRMMMPEMMQNAGLLGSGGTWVGRGDMMDSWGAGGLGFVFWVTTILIWILLGLGIIALWRWIQRQG